MKFVTGGLNAAASAKRHGDKRRDPEALDENDALSHELTPKLHRWLLILFVGRRENTPVTAVQAVDVVANALRPAVQLSSSMSTCEQAICVRKVHLLMKDVALSWCKELKVANGKGIKECFSWVSSKKHSKFCATTVQCVFVVLSLLVVHEQSETCTAWSSSEISRLTNTELCCQSR